MQSYGLGGAVVLSDTEAKERLSGEQSSAENVPGERQLTT